jgi:hypothetical protein
MTPIWLRAAWHRCRLFAFGLGLGQYPSLRGGAKWGIDPAFGELSWAPNGDVPSFYRGG